MSPELIRQAVAEAARPYRDTGHFNFRWARGKLGGDPVFAGLLDLQLLPSNARVIDLGCGRGLLAAWFFGIERLADRGAWTGPAHPRGLRFRGVDLMGDVVACGNAALQPLHGPRVALSAGDIRSADLTGADVIIVLDVLHYIEIEQQDRVIDRIRAALPPGGVFLVRVGDAEGGLRFRLSQAVDRCMAFLQGHRLHRMWCRPLRTWIAELEQRNFVVESHSMSSGTPFANTLLVARVPQAG